MPRKKLVSGVVVVGKSFCAKKSNYADKGDKVFSNFPTFYAKETLHSGAVVESK